jgi:serine/threonine-protein kinase
MSRRELREWYRAQRRLAVTQHLATGRAGLIVHDRVFPLKSYEERPLDERVTAFRRSVLSWGMWSAVLFGVNVSSGGQPWFLIPSAVLFFGVLRRGISIWSDGVGPLDAFKKGVRKRLRAEDSARADAPAVRALQPPPPPPTAAQLAAQLAPPDVLAGPHGDAVLRAAADRALMRDILAALRPIEREMIPEIGPTLDALATRVGSVATTLHRLDTDVSGASLGALDVRIASLQTEPDTPERERRLALLQRQRGSLHDLIDRRRSLANQLESAGLMLQNLKLDLLKLRSSGIGSAIEDHTSATQEARALSREIGHVVQAAEDLRNL